MKENHGIKKRAVTATKLCGLMMDVFQFKKPPI